MKHLILVFMLFCTTKSNSQSYSSHNQKRPEPTRIASDWKPNPKYIKQGKEASAAATKNTFQCYGTTTKGERCKRKVNAAHAFCYQHAAQQVN